LSYEAAGKEIEPKVA